MIDLRLSFRLVTLRFEDGLAPKVKELWPFEDGQNFMFFPILKNHISKTKLGRGLKFGIKIHLIGVYTYTKSRRPLPMDPGVGTQNHDPKFGS